MCTEQDISKLIVNIPPRGEKELSFKYGNLEVKGDTRLYVMVVIN